MKIDSRMARCLCRLQEPDFAAFHDYLRALRDDALNLLIEVSADTSMRQYQGRVRALNDVLRDIEKAREILKKLEP